jgi:hypothetical protein
MSLLKSLQDIFDDDVDGLLNTKPVQTAAQTTDARLLASFADVTAFYREHQREPLVSNGMNERLLAMRLQGIRGDAVKVGMLAEHDAFGLLGGVVKKQPTSLDELFEDDDLNLLGGEGDGQGQYSAALCEGEDIFNLKHVGLTDLQRAESDYVARRKPCKDFALFEAGFKAVQGDLVEGKRKLLPYTDALLKVGTYYVHNGMLMLFEKIESLTDSETLETGKRIRRDGRTRCVFENGTESNMLYRSVSKILYANGQVVTPQVDVADVALLKDLAGVTDDDQPSGMIYVLKSCSSDPQIQGIRHLYKIGYSTTDVDERIKNAETEPTYLMAKVESVAEYQCFNLNPQKLEQLLHNFFGKSCLNITITDKAGRLHTPREWFVAPFNVIDRAIHLIITGEIVHHRYDDEAETIVPKNLAN